MSLGGSMNGRGHYAQPSAPPPPRSLPRIPAVSLTLHRRAPRMRCPSVWPRGRWGPAAARGALRAGRRGRCSAQPTQTRDARTAEPGSARAGGVAVAANPPQRPRDRDYSMPGPQREDGTRHARQCQCDICPRHGRRSSSRTGLGPVGRGHMSQRRLPPSRRPPGGRGARTTPARCACGGRRLRGWVPAMGGAVSGAWRGQPARFLLGGAADAGLGALG